MYIEVEKLKKLLTDPIWRYMTDRKGNNIFTIIQSCSQEKKPAKKTKKK